MPAFGDYLLTTMTRMWDLLEADSAFAAFVRPGNRIYFHKDIRDPENTGATGYGKTPECIIYPTEATGFSLIRGQGQMIPFGAMGSPGVQPCAFATDEICLFTIEYNFADLRYDQATFAKTMTERILAASGAKLNKDAEPELKWIKGWGPNRASFVKTSKTENGKERRAVRLKIIVPVAFNLQKTDILG